MAIDEAQWRTLHGHSNRWSTTHSEIGHSSHAIRSYIWNELWHILKHIYLSIYVTKQLIQIITSQAMDFQVDGQCQADARILQRNWKASGRAYKRGSESCNCTRSTDFSFSARTAAHSAVNRVNDLFIPFFFLFRVLFDLCATTILLSKLRCTTQRNGFSNLFRLLCPCIAETKMHAWLVFEHDALWIYEIRHAKNKKREKKNTCRISYPLTATHSTVSSWFAVVRLIGCRDRITDAINLLISYQTKNTSNPPIFAVFWTQSFRLIVFGLQFNCMWTSKQ